MSEVSLDLADEVGAEETAELLELARNGDREALNRIFEQHSPDLYRIARGKLPRGARDLLNTDDLIQEAFLRTFKKIGVFESRRKGALRSYLRRILLNLIRDEIRRVSVRPRQGELKGIEPLNAPSPLEQAIAGEEWERYATAFGKLPKKDRELIVARMELGLPYREVAGALGLPSDDAARKAVSRALKRLAEKMSDEK